MRKSVFLLAALFLLYFSVVGIQAQSYEGYIADYPVWVDLTIPTLGGALNGSYFYKKNGGSIALVGTKTGRALNLIEKDKKQEVTGIFICTDSDDSITGNWKKNNETSSPLLVRLYKTDPAYKKFAIIPKPEDLFFSKDSYYMSEEDETLESILGNSESLHNSAVEHCYTDIEYLFVQKNIFSIRVNWSCPGDPIPSHQYRAFNLMTNKEMVLWKEIARGKLSVFKKYLYQKVQPEIKEWLSEFPEMAGTLKRQPILINQNRGVIIYVANNNLHFVIDGYYGFGQASKALDFYCDISIPPQDLVKYLKPTSILRNLAKTQ
jgi:hypothetical protein